MFILIINLCKYYIFWDKSAKIYFIRPGKGTVYTDFKLSLEEITSIKNEEYVLGKKTITFPCQVVDSNGAIIASLSKDVYIRKKGGK